MTALLREDWVASPGGALRGELHIPGDKSVSHRAIMLAAIADGTSRIEGFLEGEDTRSTAAIFEHLGVRIEVPEASTRIVHGVGIDGLQAPSQSLDCGNAGTGMRLLAGLLAGQKFDSVLVGDPSLSRRPMRRVLEPLEKMGASICAHDGFPPLKIAGRQRLHGITYSSDIASAQVKSAVLLAGLHAQGITEVREPHPTRDYTERMLRAFGWPIDFSPGVARLSGGHRLRATDVSVPADFSSAAFFLVAACVIPGSDIVLRRVGMTPRRTGLLRVLRAMGAHVDIEAMGEQGGEAVADLHVRYAPLHGVEVPVDAVPDMIDEFPALFVAAACAEGATTVRGAAELRVKESDRIATMACGLRALGIAVDETPDGATIQGGAMHGAHITSHGDHRVAMAFAITGQRCDGEITIGDTTNVATSFPGFDAMARRVGFALRDA